MVYNQKCDDCVFASKCVAKNKLKPFTEEARTDLGVDLNFVGCNNYISTDQDDEVTYDNEAPDVSEH